MPAPNVYRVSDEEFIKAVQASTNIRQALLKMGLNGRGGAYKTFHKRCRALNLDLSHFAAGQPFTKGTDSITRKTLTNPEIIESCAMSISRQATLKCLSLNIDSGANVAWIDKKIEQLNISTAHWLGQGHLKGKTHNWGKSIPLNDILIEGSDYDNNSTLKHRLVKEGLLEYRCYACGIVDWQEKPLSLQLEHKNGNNRDNRIDNLTLLCPNCHSQTPTFCRRKSSIHVSTDDSGIISVVKVAATKNLETASRMPRMELPPPSLCECGAIKSRESKTCQGCYNEHRRERMPDMSHTRKVVRPSKEELAKLLWEVPTQQLGERLGVSDTAIAKWAKIYGITKPPRGYWAKKQHGKL